MWLAIPTGLILAFLILYYAFPWIMLCVCVYLFVWVVEKVCRFAARCVD